MMNRCLLLILLLGIVGCTDTADTVMLEYRNLDNEALDAMMMVTDGNQATRMDLRIFKDLRNRYDRIDKKLNIMMINRTSKELVQEVYESTGIIMYVHESNLNRDRYKLEADRIRNLPAKASLVKTQQTGRVARTGRRRGHRGIHRSRCVARPCTKWAPTPLSSISWNRN